MRRLSLNERKLQLILVRWIYDLCIGFYRLAIDATSCMFFILFLIGGGGYIHIYFCSSKVNIYILNIFILCRENLKERH